MSDMDIGDISAQLAAGKSLRAVLQRLQSDDEREMLKRLAAVHRFDAELFEVLRSVDPEVCDVSLEDLMAGSWIEPVPGSDGLYRVPSSQRDTHYRRWWAQEPGARIPSGLKALSKLVFNRRPEDQRNDPEAVYHELIVEPKEALKRFDTLFAAADEEFDLARCQDLIDVLSERLALLDSEAAELRNARRRRLRSRAMWMGDWYRTARFLLPEASREALDALLNGTDGRVLLLWGTGGMGKTSHVRSLISRRCVPDGDACARIDFDDVDPLLAAREPWTLLLEAAAQFDEQLPDAPYHELLTQYPGQRERLRRQPGAATRPLGAEAVEDVVDRFRAVLREVADRRVLLVLDTLEKALLLGGSREQTELEPLLEPLCAILQDAPALRIVLACRYDLAERVAGLDELLPELRSVHVSPLTYEESCRYLTEYRGLTRADVVERFANAAGGMPFKLELLADEAEANPDLDAAELEHQADVDVRWVMDRILQPLDPPLRLMLRYGVAPRTLERSFVRGVLTPLIAAEGGNAPFDELWPALKRYAGRASWVTLDPLDADAVRFHEAILGPMRQMLGQDPVHDELQRRAGEWYEARAAVEPARGTDWLKEAVYHRFQFEGPRAWEYFEARIEDARVERRWDRRRELAADLLGVDYVDGDDKPRKWRGAQPVLPEDALMRVRWHLAVAAVQLAHADTPERRDAERLESERALRDLEHLLKDVSPPPIGASEMALLRAGVLLGRGDAAAAAPHVALALRGSLSDVDRLWLWLVYAERADANAADSFDDALAIARTGPRPDHDRAAVWERRALHELEHDRLDLALAACERGLETAPDRLRLELRLARAQIALRIGAPTTALNGLEDVPSDEMEMQVRQETLRIRGLLGAAHAAQALELAEATGSAFAERLLAGGARQQALAAEGRELRGKVRAVMLDVDRAMADFEEAADRWGALGSAEGVCRCWTRGATLQLHGMRDLSEAGVRLQRARAIAVEPGEDAWSRRRLLGAELLALRGKRARARGLVDDVLAALHKRRRPPRAFVDAALRGLIVTVGDPSMPYLGTLCEHLARITPPATRLAALSLIAGCPTLVGDDAHRLRDLVPSPVRDPEPYGRYEPIDRALLGLRDADLDRAIGDLEAARRTLDHVHAWLGDVGSRSATEQLLLAAVRAQHGQLATELAEERCRLAETDGRVADAAILIEAVPALDEPRSHVLDVCARILEAHAAQAGGWMPRLQELRGNEAERAGDLARARDYWQRAADLYEGLGDDARRDVVHRRAVSDDALDGAVITEGELRATVRVRAGKASISVMRPGESQRHDLEAPERLAKTLTEAGRVEGRAVSPRLVSCMLADPAGLTEELTAFLREAVGRDVPSKGWSVGLRVKEVAVRAFPWELAAARLENDGVRLFRRNPRRRGEPADVRALQGGLHRVTGRSLPFDGVFGSDTAAAVAEFQDSEGLDVTGTAEPATVRRLQAKLAGPERPRVAIVRPTRRAEELAFRGSRQGGAPIEWRYELAGFECVVLDAPSPEELEWTLERTPVAILHLNVGLVDHHGTAAIDLSASPAPKPRRALAGRLSGIAFHRLIPRDLPTPLVVLDVPGPQAAHETVTQMLLRNAFAAELASLGVVRTILATGLARYAEQRRLYDTLVDALAEGVDVYEVVSRIRRIADAGGRAAHSLPFSSAALFTRRPTLRYPAPEADGSRRS